MQNYKVFRQKIGRDKKGTLKKDEGQRIITQRKDKKKSEKKNETIVQKK